MNSAHLRHALSQAGLDPKRLRQMGKACRTLADTCDEIAGDLDGVQIPATPDADAKLPAKPSTPIPPPGPPPAAPQPPARPAPKPPTPSTPAKPARGSGPVHEEEND